MAKHNLLKILVILTLFTTLITSVSAHEEFPEELAIGKFIKDSSVWVILIAAVIVAILTIIAIYTKNKTEGKKILLFISITIPIIIATLYLAISTIYLNVISETSGPVHWHADFEIWNCGEFVDLEDPTGLSNRIGSSVLHEHGDFRIHVESVLVEKRHADLHTFFEVIGGSLTERSIVIPTNTSLLQVKNGDLCKGKPGKLQVFLYRITNPSPLKKTGFLYEQIKLEDFEDYVLSPWANIPPGDCIIIEFDEVKDSTDRMCESYRAALKRGDLTKA